MFNGNVLHNKSIKKYYVFLYFGGIDNIHSDLLSETFQQLAEEMKSMSL